MPPTTDEFRAELRAQIERARRQGRPHAEINAGELHRKLGGYPPKSGRPAAAMPSCANVMWQEYKEDRDDIIHQPKEKRGPSLTIRYKF